MFAFLLRKVRSKANVAVEKCKAMRMTFDDPMSQQYCSKIDDRPPLCTRRRKSNQKLARGSLIPQCLTQFLREKSVTRHVVNRSLRHNILRKVVNISMISSAQNLSSLSARSQVPMMPKKKLFVSRVVSHKTIARSAGQLRRSAYSRQRNVERNYDRFGVEKNFCRAFSMEKNCPIYDRKPKGFGKRCEEKGYERDAECPKDRHCRENERDGEMKEQEKESTTKFLENGCDDKCKRFEKNNTLRNTIGDQKENDVENCSQRNLTDDGKITEKCTEENDSSADSECSKEKGSRMHTNPVKDSLTTSNRLNKPAGKPLRKKTSDIVSPCALPESEVHDQSKCDPPPPRIAHWSERQSSNSNSCCKKKRFTTVKPSAMYFSPDQSCRKHSKSSPKSNISPTCNKRNGGGRARYSTCSNKKQGNGGVDGGCRGKTKERSGSMEYKSRLQERECAATKFAPSLESESKYKGGNEVGGGTLSAQNNRLRKVNIVCSEENTEKSAGLQAAEVKSHQDSVKNEPECMQENVSKPQDTKLQKVNVTCPTSVEKNAKCADSPKANKVLPSCADIPENPKCTNCVECPDGKSQQTAKDDKFGDVIEFVDKCPGGITLPKPREELPKSSPSPSLTSKGILSAKKSQGSAFTMSDVSECKPNVASLKYRLSKCPNMKEMWKVPEFEKPSSKGPLKPKRKRDADILASRRKIKKTKSSGEWSKQRYVVRLKIYKDEKGVTISPASPKLTEVRHGRSADRTVDSQLANVKKPKPCESNVSAEEAALENPCPPKKRHFIDEMKNARKMKESCVGLRNREYYERIMKKRRETERE